MQKNTHRFKELTMLCLAKPNAYIANAEFALEALKNPYPYKLVNLGKGINTDRDEYFPSLTADDELLLFTRNIKDQRAMAGQGIQEDIFVSRITPNGWSNAIGISYKHQHRV
jgi:hypothetical protein